MELQKKIQEEGMRGRGSTPPIVIGDQPSGSAAGGRQ
jgi:hypothetical protein